MTRTGRFAEKRESSYWDIRDEGTRGTRIAEGAESQSNNATCHRPNEGRGSPFRVDRKFLAPSSLGHPGQKTRRARRSEKPAENQTRSRHVSGERVQ
ncbi:hypothetical protein KI387_004485, partial [Taxus chinensis]